MKDKNNSAFIIGGSIIIGFTIFGLLLMMALEQSVVLMDDLNVGGGNNRHHEESDNGIISVAGIGDFELIPIGDNNIILFDTVTGEYWTKFVPSDEGPTDWEKGKLPKELEEEVEYPDES